MEKEGGKERFIYLEECWGSEKIINVLIQRGIALKTKVEGTRTPPKVIKSGNMNVNMGR